MRASPPPRSPLRITASPVTSRTAAAIRTSEAAPGIRIPPRPLPHPPRQRRLEPKVLLEGCEGRVGVEESEVPAQAEGGDQAVDGVGDGGAVLGAQALGVLGGEEGDLQGAELVAAELEERPPGGLEALLLLVAGEDLGDDQVADHQPALPESAVQVVGLARQHAAEVVHPDRGVNEDLQRSPPFRPSPPPPSGAGRAGPAPPAARGAAAASAAPPPPPPSWSACRSTAWRGPADPRPGRCSFASCLQYTRKAEKGVSSSPSLPVQLLKIWSQHLEYTRNCLGSAIFHLRSGKRREMGARMWPWIHPADEKRCRTAGREGGSRAGESWKTVRIHISVEKLCIRATGKRSAASDPFPSARKV